MPSPFHPGLEDLAKPAAPKSEGLTELSHPGQFSLSVWVFRSEQRHGPGLRCRSKASV